MRTDGMQKDVISGLWERAGQRNDRGIPTNFKRAEDMVKYIMSIFAR